MILDKYANLKKKSLEPVFLENHKKRIVGILISTKSLLYSFYHILSLSFEFRSSVTYDCEIQRYIHTYIKYTRTNGI